MTEPRAPSHCPESFQITIVKSGDTMYNIAKRFNISLQKLIKANSHIQNPDIIYPGDKLCVPFRRTSRANIKDAINRLIRIVSDHPKDIEKKLKEQFGKLTELQKNALQIISNYDYKSTIIWALQDSLKLEKVYPHTMAAYVSSTLRKSTKLPHDVTQEVGLILKWYLESYL